MNRSVFRFLLPLVLAGVLATALFGFSIMMNSSGRMMAGCFGSAPATDCSILSPIEHFEAHTQAFHQVSTAIAQASASFAVLLLVFLAAAIALLWDHTILQHRPIVFRNDRDVPPRHIRLTHWLALREKRDPSPVYAMN